MKQIKLTPEQADALKQVIEYRTVGLFAKPDDGFIYQWYLKKVMLKPLVDLTKMNLLEAFQSPTGLKLKIVYKVRVTDEGLLYGASQGWTPWVGDIAYATQIEDVHQRHWRIQEVGRLTSLHIEGDYEKLNSEMRRNRETVQQFQSNMIDRVLSIKKWGSELVPADIIYNTGYGVWEIILERNKTHMLCRGYNTTSHSVSGLTRKKEIEPKTEYRLYDDAANSFVVIDWNGHRKTTWDKTIRL